MEATRLIVGGFNQPAVARCLIELPGNAEKGLSQRFLWLFSKPVYANWCELKPINKKFYDTTGIHVYTSYCDDAYATAYFVYLMTSYPQVSIFYSLLCVFDGFIPIANNL